MTDQRKKNAMTHSSDRQTSKTVDDNSPQLMRSYLVIDIMNIKPPIRPEIDHSTTYRRRATPSLLNAIAKRLTWEYKGKTQPFIFKKASCRLFVFRQATDGDRHEPHLFGVAEMLSPAAATACEPRYHVNCYAFTTTWLRAFSSA